MAGFLGVLVARWMLMGIVFLEMYWMADNHNCTVRTVQLQCDDADVNGIRFTTCLDRH